MPRTFEDAPAVLGKTPLLIGLTGYSGSGKTYSALRLATGIQRVRGGDIYGIDTEGGRMRQYADRFKFRHVPFMPPHGPQDYLAAIEHCVSKRAKIIVVDSMSHEHEGEGGVLEQSERYLDQKCGDDWKKRQAYQQLSWQAPKAARKQLNRRVVSQLTDITFVFCYRGQEKVKMVKGEEPIQLGTQAITTSNLVYDMTVRFLLRPGADGVPAPKAETPAEAMMMKQIETFRGWQELKVQLSEDLGEKLAKWAEGGPGISATPSSILPRFNAAYGPRAGEPLSEATLTEVADYIAWLEDKKRAGAKPEALAAIDRAIEVAGSFLPMEEEDHP